jgi:hypothetical protein
MISFVKRPRGFAVLFSALWFFEPAKAAFKNNLGPDLISFDILGNCRP